MISESTLTCQVYVAPIIAMAGKDVPPGQSRSTWSPISATLISGRHDAVLVDPLMTVEQGMAVADGVSTTGKNLTTSTGSTRKPPRRRNSTGRCWRFTRTESTPAHCGSRPSRQRPERRGGSVCQILLADARSRQPARRFDATASSDYLRAGGGD